MQELATPRRGDVGALPERIFRLLGAMAGGKLRAIFLLPGAGTPLISLPASSPIETAPAFAVLEGLAFRTMVLMEPVHVNLDSSREIRRWDLTNVGVEVISAHISCRSKGRRWSGVFIARYLDA
jgi:hypothetical protein